MLIAIFALIVALFVLSLYSERLPRHYHWVLFAFVVVAMTVMCIVRPTSYNSDFLNYEKFFFGFDQDILKLLVEPTYLWISRTVYYAGGTIYTVLAIYALLSVPLKLYALRKLTDSTLFLLAACVYAGNYFMLHDCEQIRIAVALTFGMYAIYLKSRDNWLWIAFVLFGVAFHHTLAVLAAPIIVAPREIRGYWWFLYYAVVPVAILLWITHISVLVFLPIPYIETRIQAYEIAMAQGQHPDIRVINSLVIARVAIYYYLIYYYDNIKQHVKALPILLLCYAASLFAWFGLTDMVVIAVRLSQLFGFVEVILFASLAYTVRPRWAGKVIVLLLSLYQFAQLCISNQFDW
ncbi:MAG: EpsG family protein [Bacteroidaceae bacterium]|nr:EpsG family protein [Bacteroidaceae bacterium]